MTTADERFMRRALELAHRGSGWVAPNPKVGAVLARDGEIIAEGWHAQFGHEHAEAMALRLAGHAARGSTMYVTLEPCDHQGKTPPCSVALIEAGVARVVYASDDPNPVARGGAARLRAAGVSVSAGMLRESANEANAPFLFAAHGASRPFVTLKLAVSIDGAIVDATRQRSWLTGSEARAAVHALRADADAVAVGIDTVIADDAELTVRDARAPRVAPVRVVFDRRARLPLSSALVKTATAPPVVVLTDGSNPEREGALEATGVVVLRADGFDRALAALHTRGIRHLLVEGGAGIASALVAKGLVDRLITFQAPVILGQGALAAFAFLPPAPGGPRRMHVVTRRELGHDLMTVYGFES
ncbi:MAG: bifunctional diaminohydroxyphosphoribosylaminopyrimidine deaminase/5-amino-6-(5-phosphoribosylamino)uracil reductase RibD [Gemmatimonas sp.]